MKKLRLLMVCLTIVGISGCDILLGPNTPLGKGTLSIGFGDGGGSRNARSLDEGTLAALRYELVLSGPDNQTINVSLTAGKTFKEQVSLGEWRIEAEAYNDDNVLFGEGMTTVRVRAGANEAEVPMTVVDYDTLVSDFDLSGLITAPVNGETPDTTPIATEEYTGSITWYDEDGTLFSENSFAEATVYHAVVSLEAKSGFTFDGLAADSFRHDAPGVTVTNEAGTGNTITVTIIFPPTGAAGPTEYTVTFNLNYGTNEDLVTKTVSSGASIGSENFPAAPARTDYNFEGWNTEPGGSGDPFIETSTVSGNITVYAQWTDNSSPPQYTITFNSHDGSLVASITDYTGTEVAEPEVPTRTGYTFLGWFNEDMGGTLYSWPHTLTGNVTMHAQWLPQYTITFNSHGGSPVTPITANAGTAVNKPEDPILTGYDFVGWFTEETGGTKYTWSHTLIGNVTMHAQWTVNDFNLTSRVTAPVKGAMPDTTINAAEYTGAISWQKWDGTSFTSFSGNFAVATVYQAVLNLTAAAGYTFAGVAVDSFTHTGATTVTNPVGNGTNITVTITFPPTAEVFGNGTITLSFNDAGSGAFDETDFTVKQGDVTQATQSITLLDSWDSAEWRVDGVFKSNNLTSFTVDAADYTGGGHILQVTVKDGNKFWSKTLRFKVTSVVTGISLNKPSMDLLKGETRTLTATVSPLHAADKAVTWVSSNDAVATVSAGMVTAVGVGGPVTITVTSVDDPSKNATCTINVTDAVSGDITLSFNDAGEGAFNEGTFIVKQSESGTKIITLLGSWDSQEWRVDGVLKSGVQNFTVDANDYTVGGHILQVTVKDGNNYWSKTLPFTVEN